MTQNIDAPSTIPLLDDQGQYDEKFYKPGDLVQYMRIGPGYAPTPYTIKKLPADVYRVTNVNDVFCFEAMKFVTDDLLRLPDSKSDFVVAEIEKFWTLKDTYSKFGFCHKRGFLLYGPPGGGKTSTIALVTKDMVERDGIVVVADIHPANLSLMLQRLRKVEPERAVVVILEDLDALINKYGDSNFLAILDGEESIDRVTYIATTNYPEVLDQRITNRPGRFDRIVYIGMPNADARRAYLRSRKCLNDEQIDEIVSMTEGLSIAHLKEIVVGVHIFGGSVAEDIERVGKMKTAPDSERSPDRKSAGFTPIKFVVE